ncbi:M16 family metallopeptidase [Bartonella sp. DGB1]|uniref:M16 family metallopeptidase n=1 Tax=Bartonella sp. DGB1 TaxID=3239807 RepID=UPI003523962D
MPVNTSILDNGITITTQNMKHMSSTTLGIWVKNGSRNEQLRQHGLSHLLEHMAFKGTNNFSAKEIAETIENVGGEINASTGVEMTSYYTKLLKDDTYLGLDILTDILTNPIFKEEDLIKEKNIIMQEIGAAFDTPDDILFDYFMATAYPNQSLGRSILGTKETISHFTPLDIHDYMNQNYHSQCLTLCAVGNIDHTEFTDKAAQKLSNYRSPNAKPYWETANYVGGSFIERRSLIDTQFILGFKGFSSYSDEFYLSQILSIILGGGMSSRLFQEVRENLGLCYSIYSFNFGYSDSGLFGIYSATSGSDIELLTETIIKELKKISEQITEEELHRAKTQYKAQLIMSQEHTESRCGQIARQILLNGHSLPNAILLEKINNITTEDLKNIAIKLFTSAQPTLTIIGEPTKLILAEEIFNKIKT